ncbi:hypothetical protein SLA_2362 [Streptomyces laurentii]|uniref:Uncharacterized protein n=1 Tax=Streptomyces laurentii TaxID=39478 RepID=A0A160NZE0_STRLU|nr:hypothetical protein SLA_2362 [Streptomyces laurentii]
MQKPSVRPGRSPRERPTGAPQSDREQNRFLSGTSGFAITAPRGSGRGTPGIVTRPAPSRPRVDWAPLEPELRTDTERAVLCPDSDRDSRPDTDRRDAEDRADARDEARELRTELLPDSRAGTATPVGFAASTPLGATTGASPQVSQYSSPPPMSSYDPSHDGR